MNVTMQQTCNVSSPARSQKKKQKPRCFTLANNANIFQVSSYSVVVVPPVIRLYLQITEDII